MKRSTTRWTTTIAAAAWLALPAAGWSQTPPATSPPSPAQKPATQQPATGVPGHASAQEHIRQAKAALNDIPAASLQARAKTQTSDLKRHLNSLDKAAEKAASSSAAAASSAGTTGSKSAPRAKDNWATEVAAIDKILTELLGPATTSATSPATGATGTAGTAGTLDETAKTKLMEIRSHVTAFAASMSGTAAGTSGTPQPSAEPATAAATQPAATQPAATSPTQPAASATSATSTTNAAQAQPQAQAAVTPQVNAEGAKRHLTSARDTLTQLTQLPAAAQLTGDARTQVAQLIVNFNELITTNGEWRASYDKLNANITALLGAEGAEQPQPAAQPPATGTPGAVGTAGATTATLDPAVRAKLVEFRNHVKEFEKAAGGVSSTTASAAPPSAPATAAAGPVAGAATGTTGSTSATPTAAATTTGATPTATTGATPTATMSAATTATMNDQAAATAGAQRSDTAGQDSALRHIDAIEAILTGRAPATATTPGSAAPAGAATGATPTGSATSGTSGKPAAATTAGVTLDRAQVEQIQMHLTELRKAVSKK